MEGRFNWTDELLQWQTSESKGEIRQESGKIGLHLSSFDLLFLVCTFCCCCCCICNVLLVAIISSGRDDTQGKPTLTTLHTDSLFIWTLVERFISRWSISVPQWELHKAILCFRADPLSRFGRVRLWMSDCSVTQRVFEYAQKWCICRMFGCYMAGAMWNRLLPSGRTFCTYTIRPCTSLQCHFIRSRIHRAHLCSAITCHLHFWQSH